VLLILFIEYVDVVLVKVDQSIIVMVDPIQNNSVICEPTLHVVERVKIVDTIHGLVAKSHSTEHIPSSTLTDITVVAVDVFGKDDSVLMVER
jgi:hypothetical protein